MWWKRKQPIDETLAQAYRLSFATMIEPHRIYAWAVSHKVDLKTERKRLLRNGLLEECVFRDLPLD